MLAEIEELDTKEVLYWGGFFYAGVGGENNLRQIIKMYGDAKNAWEELGKERIHNKIKEIFSAKKIESLTRNINKFSILELEEKLNKNQIAIINLDSNQYPKKLKLIKNPPLVIYVRGPVEKLESTLSENLPLGVVGTRRPTDYGRTATRHLLDHLLQYKIATISGLAVGVDFLAHKISLERNVPTLAVLAGGLNSIYPKEHTILAQKIIDQDGFLVSEFPPGVSYFRQNFPARNRIISGLSKTLLVIEAGEKSGALITADFAFAQDKKVLVLPGSIFSKMSLGTNQLIAKGAIPITSPEALAEIIFEKKQKNKFSKSNSQKEELAQNLSEKEKTMFFLVKETNSLSLNEIIRKTGLSTSEATATLTSLELKNLVERRGDRINLR